MFCAIVIFFKYYYLNLHVSFLNSIFILFTINNFSASTYSN